jgi:hypothetical protein
VSFGVGVEGTDYELVAELRRILSMDGNLTATGSIAATGRGGVVAGIAFGVIRGVAPPAAVIAVGVKPIK